MVEEMRGVLNRIVGVQCTMEGDPSRRVGLRAREKIINASGGDVWPGWPLAVMSARAGARTRTMTVRAYSSTRVLEYHGTFAERLHDTRVPWYSSTMVVLEYTSVAERVCPRVPVGGLGRRVMITRVFV